MKGIFKSSFPIEYRRLTYQKLIAYQEVSHPGFHTETIEHTIYATVDLLTQEFEEIKTLEDWRALYLEFEGCAKDLVPNKIWVWARMMDATPYEKLTAYQQKRRDRYNGDYPRRNSKYWEEVTLEELVDIKDSLLMDAAQNINDWRMYGDPEPEGYRGSVQGRVKYLNDWIEEIS